MTTLDLAIILTYLLAMLGIGLYYRRYAGQGLETFFLAGRNIPGWLNGVSMQQPWSALTRPQPTEAWQW